MPKLLKRYYGADDPHYITCSCYERRPLLGTAPRRDLFLTVLEQVPGRYRLEVLGYVVMPEHFHLLISEPQKGTPSTVMQALKLGFARRVRAEMARAQVSKPRDLGHSVFRKILHSTSGKHASTTSTCGANTNASRSCGTSTAIPWNVAW